MKRRSKRLCYTSHTKKKKEKEEQSRKLHRARVRVFQFFFTATLLLSGVERNDTALNEGGRCDTSWRKRKTQKDAAVDAFELSTYSRRHRFPSKNQGTPGTRDTYLRFDPGHESDIFRTYA